MIKENLLILVEKVSQSLRQNNLKISSAESCTGGLLSALFTDISGASDIFERGFVTYSNQAKIDMLEVKKETLERFGAVSSEVAEEMSRGALINSKSDIIIAITGIAGPNSDDTKKPVGLVYISIASAHQNLTRQFNFDGSRSEVREKTIIAALSMLETSIQTH